jgi:hypothetical protein
MKKRLVFWLARVLNVEIYEKQTTEIAYRTSAIPFSTIDIRKAIPSWQLKDMQMSGEVTHFKNELAVALANKLIEENKVLIEQYNDDYNRMHHIRLVVEVADQKK